MGREGAVNGRSRNRKKLAKTELCACRRERARGSKGTRDAEMGVAWPEEDQQKK